MSDGAGEQLALVTAAAAAELAPSRSNRGRLRELRAAAAASDRRSRCISCGCTARGPRCTIRLDDAGSIGMCVPRGTLGLSRCSGCLR